MCTQLCLTLSSPLDCNHPGSSALGFPRQEYWHGLPLPPPGDLPSPGMEPGFHASPSLAGGFFTRSTTWEAPPPSPPVVYISSYFLLSLCMYVCSVCICVYAHMWVIFTETFESKWQISCLFTPKYLRMYFLRTRTFSCITTVWLSLLQRYLNIHKHKTGHKIFTRIVLLQLHSQNLNLQFKCSP